MQSAYQLRKVSLSLKLGGQRRGAREAGRRQEGRDAPRQGKQAGRKSSGVTLAPGAEMLGDLDADDLFEDEVADDFADWQAFYVEAAERGYIILIGQS